MSRSAKTHKELMRIPTYSQLDPRWKDVRLGYSPHLTIGSHGCVICCIAMMLAACGIEVDPPQVNEELKRARAFVAGSGRAIWTRVGIAYPAVCCPRQQWYSGRKAKIEVTDLPVLVELALPSGSHWVLAVTNQSRGTVIHDPLLPAEQQRAVYITDRYRHPRITRTVTFSRAQTQIARA